MLSRSVPRASAELAFSAIEIELLKRVAHDTPRNAQAPPLMRTSSGLRSLVAIWRALTIPRPETPSCGQECDG
jgi:hypothetical protein